LFDIVTSTVIESLDLQVDERKAHYLKAGSGPPVVLLHGGASDSSDWRETMPALSQCHTLYAPDILGYGLSDRNKSAYYLSEFVDFTFDFIQKLGLGSVDLVGHSIGGRICLEIALQHPEKVRKLVLIDSAGLARLARWGTFLGAAAWAIRGVLRRPQPYPRFLIKDGEDKDWRCLDKLATLKMPTLVIWSSRDPYYPLKEAIEAKHLIPGVRFEIFEGYGHAPHVKNRDYFNNLLLSYLDHNQPCEPQKQP
jgi:pimeloyl-ACP methyl ester carboxylesterase